MYVRSHQSLTQKKQVIYHQDKTAKEKKTAKKAVTAGTCANTGKNPNLFKRYENTDAVSCGVIPPGNTNIAAVESVRSCIQAALEQCKISKSYIYVQGFEGSIEYLVNTNNCELLVERWGTMDPYCGYEIDSCKNVSSNFPSEICIGTVQQSDVIQPQEFKGSAGTQTSETACISEEDCFSKTSCSSQRGLCTSHPACVNNSCVCLEVCQ
jgi:hypothetical protein